MHRLLTVVLAAALLPACRDLVDPTLGVCGNRIVEAGEDCDDPDDPRCGAANLVVGCRILCALETSEPPCPAGHGCGTDGVCRSPRDRFTEEAISVEEPGARWIREGDLDGDGRDDLVIQFVEPDGRDVKAIYFDLEQGVEVVTVLEPAIAVGAVGDLDGDGLADMLLAREAPPGAVGGVEASLWRGTIDHALVHSDFATLRTEGEEARLIAPASGHDRILEVVDASTTRRWSSDRSAAIDVDPIGFAGVDLGASVPVADLDGGGCASPTEPFGLPRNEVAIARIGASAVLIASTCGAGTRFELGAEVTLPDGGELGDAGAFFVHAGPGPALDLVVQDRDGAVWLAWGVGDGSFHSAAGVPAAGGDGIFSALARPEEELGRLLAVDDFDRDGALDLVLEGGYVREADACTEGSCPSWPWPLDSELAFAVAVDINADGAVDIAGLADDFLWVLLAAPLRAVPFEAHAVEQVGDVRELVTGDFDHDTVPDVALAVFEEDLAPAADETIAILYGGAVNGWRLEILGPFAHVETLAVDGGDTIVARLRDEQGRASGAFLRPGVTEYDFGLVPRAPTIVRVATGLAAAAIVLGEGGDVLGHVGFVAGALSPHDITLGDPLDLSGFHAVMAAIDLNGDALDEVLVLGPEGVRVAAHESAGWRIVTAFELDVGFAGMPVDAIELARTHPPPGGGPGTTITVADVDADGDLDALATTDEAQPRLALLRNEDGRFAAAASELLPSADFELARVCAWHADIDGTPRFLAGGVDGVAILRVHAGAVELAMVSDVAADALAAADIDGDGLLDLVLGASHDTLVHRAVDATLH